MADEKSTTETARRDLREFRRIVANVVTELRSQEVRNTYAAITLGEVIDAHLKFLVGPGRAPSRRERLVKTHAEFVKSIEAIKATPPDAFRQHDPKRDVNTAKE